MQSTSSGGLEFALAANVSSDGPNSRIRWPGQGQLRAGFSKFSLDDELLKAGTAMEIGGHPLCLFRKPRPGQGSKSNKSATAKRRW